MKKIPLGFLLSFFPLLALAQESSLSFTPPLGDYSVIFLGDIFGIVDGVLSGTGSQIMGKMFGVFNAAVLALGGIVIMYTLLVSTMNTAHEGQMLGQKWSSIYIPIRSTAGLALLIPKASGYCLMQIFVMWVVVQGVGAADKIWNAALNYLNMGGAIVQAQQNPAEALVASMSSGVAGGAQTILAGQVCMQGVENILQNQLQLYQSQKQENAGPCAGNPTGDMQTFCNSTVPSFINSVNVVTVQQNMPSQTTYSVPMPNFDSNSPYAALNGICGTISWNNFQLNLGGATSVSSAQFSSALPELSQQDLETTQMSRAISIQQMYTALSTIAQNMVNNDPELSTQQQQSNANPNNYFASFAVEQFGVPHSQLGQVCENSSTKNCTTWGPAAGSNQTTLFTGNEFQDAIAIYNGTMMNTLSLMNQAQNSQAANNTREFINQAEASGWIMAGSYFYNLVNLNAAATNVTKGYYTYTGSNGQTLLADNQSGLENSKLDIMGVTSAFSGGGTNVQCSGQYAILCTWLNQNLNLVTPIPTLINGYGNAGAAVQTPNLSAGVPKKVIDGMYSSTVFGFTTNETIIQLPGQPGVQPLKFANFMPSEPNLQQYYLPSANFGCGGVHVIFFTICLGGIMGDVLYNHIIIPVYNAFLSSFGALFDQIAMAFISVPLQGMAEIFKAGMQMISSPNVNPIVALAQMGTYYINFVGTMWLFQMNESILAILIPIFGLFMVAIFALALPVVLAWLGIMLSVGFITAFYIPILPYMMFTFGSIAWLMAVIEAMVAAPIVALGVTHPEGHDAFGKGEQAIMILLNVFLRPSMMIIGYIAGIALAYVGIWVLNAGFDNAIGFIQGSSEFGTGQKQNDIIHLGGINGGPSPGSVSGGYNGWAGIFAYFFSILIYTSMYVVIVQKAFGLIAQLPDKILRWIGGQPESYGQETAQWGEEVKGKVSEGEKAATQGMGQVEKNLGGIASKGQAGAKDFLSQKKPRIGGDTGGEAT